ncbi:MAG: hypothetical protein HY903_19900 [Deltaproteobacteria bacterium]|nr:hypothetical protein [Deltaproteobacteria bacterium]
MPTSGLPTVKASDYPIVGKIVADVFLDDKGECLMPIERFEHWARTLSSKYPRKSNPKVYHVITGMALEFAKRKAFAAIQLLALGTMGLRPPEAAAAAEGNAFLRSQQAKQALQKLSQAMPGSPAAGMARPVGGGMTLRGPKRPERKDKKQ